MVLSIREYDKLHIREKRDLTRNQISKDDAAVLQRLVIDDLPVFKWGNRCLIAQQWVGVIDLPEYSIEILPKLAREIENEKCRDILTRMLLVAHQSPSTRKLPGSVNSKKNALTEVLISAFLGALEIYIKSGVLNAYQKVQNNIDVVKGRIVFSKQFKQNVLSPTRFYCSYSKYISDNPVNQFLATCLSQMSCISRDNDNLRRIRAAEQYFEGVQILEVRKALNLKINFNSINSSAVESYNFGYMFLSCNFMTVNAGGIAMNVMLFDMNHLDLFAGVGGLSLGFENCGFQVVLANEYYRFPAQSDYQVLLRKESTLLYNHVATKHSPVALERLAMIPPKGGKEFLPKEHLTKSIYSGTWCRMDADDISVTITTRFDTPSSGKFTHPYLNRAITVREAARIPDVLG